MKKCITVWNNPLRNEDYPKIINQQRFERLLGLLKSGRVVEGGQAEEKTRQIAPTILDNVTWESAVMQEEIFGPLLPVLEFESFDAALS